MFSKGTKVYGQSYETKKDYSEQHSYLYNFVKAFPKYELMTRFTNNLKIKFFFINCNNVRQNKNKHYN